MTERSYVFRTQATSIRHRIVPDWIVALSNNHRPRARTFCNDRYSTRTFCNDRYRTRARTYRADRYPAQGQEPGTGPVPEPIGPTGTEPGTGTKAHLTHRVPPLPPAQGQEPGTGACPCPVPRARHRDQDQGPRHT